MRPYSALTDIRPKVSTMPRQKTEAAAYLNLYKLSVEKKRLQYELDTLDQRRQRIQKRLAFLDSQVAELERSAQELRSSEPSTPPAIAQKATAETKGFDTLFLDY
jgi:predicted  nucleic acid-binding Zn-ribbon protein